MLSLSVFGQGEQKSSDLSKFELGGKFTSAGSTFFPQLTLNYYRKENKILHFGGGVGLGNFGYVITGDFWNEYRRYISEKEKWYFSHGFTISGGYSRFNFTQIPDVTNSTTTFAPSLGYKVGGGFRINDHFTISANLNPRAHYFFGSRNFEGKKYDFNVPLTLGINYRF